jgi:hypothetical protein
MCPPSQHEAFLFVTTRPECDWPRFGIPKARIINSLRSLALVGACHQGHRASRHCKIPAPPERVTKSTKTATPPHACPLPSQPPAHAARDPARPRPGRRPRSAALSASSPAKPPLPAEPAPLTARFSPRTLRPPRLRRLRARLRACSAPCPLRLRPLDRRPLAPPPCPRLVPARAPAPAALLASAYAGCRCAPGHLARRRWPRPAPARPAPRPSSARRPSIRAGGRPATRSTARNSGPVPAKTCAELHPARGEHHAGALLQRRASSCAEAEAEFRPPPLAIGGGRAPAVSAGGRAPALSRATMRAWPLSSARSAISVRETTWWDPFCVRPRALLDFSQAGADSYLESG